jgi:hypothetical protein
LAGAEVAVGEFGVVEEGVEGGRHVDLMLRGGEGVSESAGQRVSGLAIVVLDYGFVAS